MELTDIMALVKAGYTKDEITQMDKAITSNTNTAVNVEPVTNAVPDPAPAPTPVAESVAVPTAAPTQQETQPTMAELMQSIAKLTSAVQANAIAQSVIPAGVSNPPNAEDMLAEIIRPTFHQRGD